MPRPARGGNGNDLARRLGVSRQRVSALKKSGKLKTSGPSLDVEASERMHRERLAAQQPSASRQVKELYDAKMAKLEYEKAVGLVVETSVVRREYFRLARIVRDAIMSIPDRLAGELAAEHDQIRIHAILSKELSQALAALGGALSMEAQVQK